MHNEFANTVRKKIMAVNLEIVKELVQPKLAVIVPVIEEENQLSCPDDLPIDWRIEYEERAAILEYDGGLTREKAETQALDEILKKIETNNWN